MPPAAAASRCRIADSGLPGSAQLAHRSMTTRTWDDSCSRLPKLASSTSMTNGDGGPASGPGAAPPRGRAGRRRRWHGSSVRTGRWHRRRPLAWRRPVAGGPGGSWVHLHTTGRTDRRHPWRPRRCRDSVNPRESGIRSPTLPRYVIGTNRALSVLLCRFFRMTRIALFHSVLGVRPGVLAAADVFRDAGHQVAGRRPVRRPGIRRLRRGERSSSESIGYPGPDGVRAACGRRRSGAAGHRRVLQRRRDGRVCRRGPRRPGRWRARVAAVQRRAAAGDDRVSRAGRPRRPCNCTTRSDDPFRNQAWVDQFVGDVRRPARRSRRSWTTRSPGTCSPTRRCPTSTTRRRPRWRSSGRWSSWIGSARGDASQIRAGSV